MSEKHNGRQEREIKKDKRTREIEKERSCTSEGQKELSIVSVPRIQDHEQQAVRGDDL